MAEQLETAAVWQGKLDISSDPEEKQHLCSVLDSFRQFRRTAHYNTTHIRRQNFYALPSQQQTLLKKPPFSLLDIFSQVDDAIDANADLADAILDSVSTSDGLTDDDEKGALTPNDRKSTATTNNINKVRKTLEQLYRDWSAEGRLERLACYSPIIQDLAELFSVENRSNVSVLVPGAGLCRLVFELCRNGYKVEGNEISYQQLITSSFIINRITKEEEWSLYPWAMSFTNNLSRADQLRQIRIPDICPQNTPCQGTMNITAGDFCALYRSDKHAQRFDAIVTVFFIDTAPNLISYIETVAHCLKQGGYWINLGPLLWHFSGEQRINEENGGDLNTKDKKAEVSDEEERGIGEPGGFELCEDEVIALLKEYGFEVQKHDTDSISTGYVTNTKSMLRTMYQPSHWVARKL